MYNTILRYSPILACLALVILTTCGKDSPTKPEPPDPPPPVTPVATRIEVTPSSPSLNAIGQTIQLTAKVFDQNNDPMNGAAVTWSCSDIGVATVNAQGLVTAIKNGSAVITARSGSVSGTSNVTVSQTAGSIVIEPVEATLMSIGETVQLTATVLDNNGQPVAGAMVTWQSSDVAVARVSGEGLVTAVKNGVARITARSGSAEESVPVSVMQSAASIVIDPEEATLMSGETVQLTARVLDNNGQPVAGAMVTWQSSNEAVVVVSDKGLVTAVMFGTAEIHVKLGDVAASAVVYVIESHKDREVLVAFFNSTNGRFWNENTNWLSEAPLNDWYGVDTDDQGRVTVLGLFRNGLTGNIPPEIGQLAKLLYLELSSNNLVGPIPPELGQLNSLTSLRLSFNQLEGPIPQEFGQLTYLATLELHRNQLSGTIPVQLSELTNLKRLSLSQNRLTGLIPREFARLVNLEELGLPANRLTGSIPTELSQLSNLVLLSLGHNQLSGDIPPDLGKLKNLRVLSLGHNQLSGSIPPELGRLSNLYSLGLSNNLLTGPVPHELGELNKLGNLLLENNIGLTGPLPESLTNLNLRYLYINGTNLCIPQTNEFQNWLTDITDVSGGTNCPERDLDALISLYKKTEGSNWLNSMNWLSFEPLETWFGVTIDTEGQVTELHLQANDLSGQLPNELGNLAFLKTINLSFNNALTGPIPHTLTSLNLENLILSGTQLCAPSDERFQTWLGGIPNHSVANCADSRTDYYILRHVYTESNGPNWTSNTNWLTKEPMEEWYGVVTDNHGRVTELNLYNNNLSGSISSQIGQLTYLTVLDLTGNQLSGEIPDELTQLFNLKQLWLSFNQLGGILPTDIGKLANLEKLSLGHNQLTGIIPAGIRDLTRLKELFLARNMLNGRIPEEIGQMTSLERISLRANQFRGTIPSQIGRLTNLVYLSLGSNQLTGKIPADISLLSKLVLLWLNENHLSGSIPQEIGQLEVLRQMDLSDNQLAGQIPADFAHLNQLVQFDLSENELTGGIPPVLSQMESLSSLLLYNNKLSGSIPYELGQLKTLRRLDFSINQLQGELPDELSELTNLQSIRLTRNAGLTGRIPAAYTNLNLEELYLDGTDLCAPLDLDFQSWLSGIPDRRVANCLNIVGSQAYLTQATQSLVHPVPLVSGEAALMRVFVVSESDTDSNLPPIRATFFDSGHEIHSVDVPAQGIGIPSQISEESLLSSANEIVPGEFIAPGLEMVVEIDPDDTLAPDFNLVRRIPEVGRMSIEVVDLPPFVLTLVPMLWTENPDRSVVTETEVLVPESDLFRFTRDLLPVREFQLNIREPIWTSVDPIFENREELLSEIEVIRVTDGASGYYMGILRSGGGAAGAYVSVSILDNYTIAHELGHNMGLLHAPCGNPDSLDPGYPYENGVIGAWGYDIKSGVLIHPGTPDLMSYCDPIWISDYHFSSALKYRLAVEKIRLTAAYSPETMSLLLWGGVNENGYLASSQPLWSTPVLPCPERTGHTGLQEKMLKATSYSHLHLI